MAWKTNFMNMTQEQRLTELTAIGDKLRSLRREVLAVTAARDKIRDSSRNYTATWIADLESDMDLGQNMNTYTGIESFATILEDHFIV